MKRSITHSVLFGASASAFALAFALVATTTSGCGGDDKKVNYPPKAEGDAGPQSGQVVTDIAQASHLLTPLLGTALAPLLFGIALIACGLNSTVTATMAGQIVMEGFLQIRIRPWLRRLVTRLLAIVPAIVLISISGGRAS